MNANKRQHSPKLQISWLLSLFNIKSSTNVNTILKKCVFKKLEIFIFIIKCTNRYQWYNGIDSFICLYITWKKWNFINKFPPIEILLNVWWKSLHGNSRYCPNHQNGVTSCFPKMIINMKKYIFCSKSSKYRM